MAFKNNYKDDILDLSVNEKRKYEMTTNTDGTVSFNDVTVYEQVGDTLGAKELNEISEKLNISGDRIRYNNVTDMVQILNDDGVWEDWSSGSTAIALLKNGIITTTYYSDSLDISTEYSGFSYFSPTSKDNYVTFKNDLKNHFGKYIKIVAKSDTSGATVKVSEKFQTSITGGTIDIVTLSLEEYEKSFYVPVQYIENCNVAELELQFGLGNGVYIKTIEITASDGTEGGGGSDDVELTQAEYYALPDTKLTDNKNYFIKDATENNGNLVRNGKSYTGGGVDIEAEVIDIRLKADGTKATSAGNAVREQVTELKGDLDDLENKSFSNETKAVNVTSLFTLNGFLNKEGEFISLSSGLCTDFIKAKQGDVFYLYVAQDDKNSLPIAIYDMNKNFIKGIENIGVNYSLRYLEYEVEEDCLMRISSVNANSLIYKKEHKNNSDVFDSIKNNFGELETYCEDMTQFVLDNGEDNKYINSNNFIGDYDGGFISDYIKVEEGDIIKVSSYVLYGNPVLLLYYETKSVNKVYGTETGYQTVEVTIPPMVEYVRISSLKKSEGIEFGILKNKTVVEMLDEKTTITYDIPNTHEEMVFENVTNGYIKEDGTIVSIDSYTTTDYIDLDVYDWFHIVSDYAWSACGYVVFDKDKKVLSYIKDSVGTIKRFDIEPKKEYPNGKYIRFCGTSSILKVYKRKTSHSIGDCSEEAMNTGNILYNKKIAFCGDSFTEASNLGKPDGYDAYFGCYKSYGWRIANRNKMKLYHDGVSGSTMHIVDADNPNTNHPFAYQRYKDVPNDCDYIILQFGLNESSIANDDSTKGTKESTDATTMWGSWNTVLEYLITNHPTARIGVVMSDAWMPQTYFTTLKEICEWWGVPLLDLGGDPDIPVMNGGRRSGCGLTLNPKVAELRNATFYNAEGDAHPNDAGHEWRSTVIENFIRSL